MANGNGATGWLVALGTGICAAVAAVGAALGKFWRDRRTIRKEDDDDALDRWREMTGRLEEQVERSNAVVRQQQAAVEAMWEDSSDCRESLAEHGMAFDFVFGLLQRQRVQIEALGGDPGPEIVRPTFRQRRDYHAEFLARQAAQAAALVQQAATVVLPKPAGPTPPPGGAP